MMLSVYHTLFQHYALMFLQELQFTGGKRCFCSYLAFPKVITTDNTRHAFINNDFSRVSVASEVFQF